MDDGWTDSQLNYSKKNKVYFKKETFIIFLL